MTRGGWPAHSYWIECLNSPRSAPQFIAAGSLKWPWEWTDDPAQAAIFGSIEIATKYFQRLGHSGLGIAVRRAWRGKLNGT